MPRTTTIVTIFCILSVSNGMPGRGPELDFCQQPFSFMLMFYTGGCSNDVRYPTPVLNELDEVTGSDVLDRLSEFCKKKTAVKTCTTNAYASCDQQLQTDVAAATDRSSDLCEDNGNVKADISHIFLEEMKASKIDRSRERCHKGIDTNDCWYESLDKFGLQDFNIEVKTIAEVFKDDVFFNYFRYIFQCIHNKVVLNCPSNAMTMTVALRTGMFFPPTFGINVGAILLDTSRSMSLQENTAAESF